MIILNSSRGWLLQFQFDNGLFCGQSTFQQVNIVRVFGFERVAAAKFTVESIIRGKFCIMHSVGVIKPFVGENPSVSEVLYAFKKESRLVAKIHNIQQLKITEFERYKLVRFFDNSRFNVTFVNKIV